MSSLLRRVRTSPRFTRAALLAGAVLVGGACTPQAYINEMFGPAAPEASRVAHCESKMDPNAVSPTNDHGLFQINAVHARQFEQVTGQPWATHRYSSYWNTVYAKWLYDQQGWSPWTCRP